MKFKYSRELKFGIIVIGALFLVYFGLNFLKGINIFNSSFAYYAKFEHIGGLVVSSPVQIKGYRVGQVDAIEFDFSQDKPFTVRFSVLREVRLPRGTIVEMFEDGLLGGKALQMLMPTGNDFVFYHKENDVIPSQSTLGLLGQLSNALLPKVEGLMLQADSMLLALRNLLENENLANTLETAEQLASDLTAATGQLNNLMANQIPQLLDNTNRLISDFSALSEHLKGLDIDQANELIATLDNTISAFGSTAENVSELTFGLMRVSSSADSLLIDLRQNPSRYVNFSLFGRRDR
jgi:phospholipid/cholesterol/gamma-HCH transport system substrate-binding protein